jgi:hypothetical protein
MGSKGKFLLILGGSKILPFKRFTANFLAQIHSIYSSIGRSKVKK